MKPVGLPRSFAHHRLKRRVGIGVREKRENQVREFSAFATEPKNRRRVHELFEGSEMTNVSHEMAGKKSVQNPCGIRAEFVSKSVRPETVFFHAPLEPKSIFAASGRSELDGTTIRSSLRVLQSHA